MLKQIIKEPRPSKGHFVVHTKYGMPSNHAQFIWFLTSFILFRWFYGLKDGNMLLNLLPCLSSVISSFLVSVSRSWNDYPLIDKRQRNLN